MIVLEMIDDNWFSVITIYQLSSISYHLPSISKTISELFFYTLHIPFQISFSNAAPRS